MGTPIKKYIGTSTGQMFKKVSDQYHIPIFYRGDVFMGEYHKPYAKKVSSGTGGRKRKFRDKKLAHMGGVFTSTNVAASDLRVSSRIRGGANRQKLKKAHFVNVSTKQGIKKAEIIGVVESHNPDYVRRNIVTRGAILNTKEFGKVKVTNRVGQDGVVNAVVVDKK